MVCAPDHNMDPAKLTFAELFAVALTPALSDFAELPGLSVTADIVL